MALRYYANAPATTLSASCSNSQTSLSVVSVTGLPIQYPYTVILDRGTASEEAVSVTNASGTTLTVTRAIDSTTAFSHTIGATVEHGITAQDIREANAHVNASTAVHGLAGAVVGTTDAQALTNKDLTSGTNTFPTSLVTLTGSQVLTNKTIGNTNTINGFTASRFMEADGTGKLASGSKVIPSGVVVGTSDAQALTNKDLTSGTNTFPTSLVTLTGAQALTNKDLSSSTNTFPAAPDVQVFTASGTWTKPAGAKTVVIEVLGGGGAGGGSVAASSGQHSRGSGGGAGGYGWKQVAAASLGATETVTVGSGGTGVSGTTGNAGGGSSFGTQVVVGGGSGGNTSASTAVDFGTIGGAGGTATTGTLLVPGQNGDIGHGDTSLGISGAGGNTKYGSGGAGRVTGSVGNSIVGVAASGFGAGGGGSLTSSTGAANAGGAGTAGIVIVTTYFM